MSNVVLLFPASKCEMDEAEAQVVGKGLIDKISTSCVKLDATLKDFLASLDALDQSIDDLRDVDARCELKLSTKHWREALMKATFALTVEVKRLSSHPKSSWEACGLASTLQALDDRSFALKIVEGS
jgi:hypothetical protein